MAGTNTCYSRGNLNAPILFIGEAPGSDEINHTVHKFLNEFGQINARMPIPFCGPAGLLLHGMIEWMGLNPDDYILDNVLEYYVGEEGKVRTGNQDEILEEIPNVLDKIAKIDPKLIITLGKGPLWALMYHDKMSLDTLRIGTYQGQVSDIETPLLTRKTYQYMLENGIIKGDMPMKSRKILPLYHPSAIIRDSDNSRGYKDDTIRAIQSHKPLILEVLGRIII